MVSKNRLVAEFATNINESGQLTTSGLTADLSSSITSSLDSSEVVNLIDSDYVSSRQIGGTLTVTLLQQGELTVTTGSARWYAPAALTISKITARVATAPTGSAVTILVKKSGTTASTLTISDGGTSDIDNTGFSMTAGQYLTVDVSAIGSTTAGEELNVQFLYTLD